MALNLLCTYNYHLLLQVYHNDVQNKCPQKIERAKNGSQRLQALNTKNYKFSKMQFILIY